MITSHAQAYQPGYYYTKGDRKVEGEIQHIYHMRFGKGPQNYILFKGGDKGKEKLTTSDISAFVIGKDSFAILKSFSVNNIVTLDEDFVRVVKTGKINMYMHYTSRPSSSKEITTLLEKNGVIRIFDRTSIDEVAKQFFGDNPALAQQMKNTKWRDFDLKQFVDQYNQAP